MSIIRMCLDNRLYKNFVSGNVGKLFSELKLVTDNLLFIYAEAN